MNLYCKNGVVIATHDDHQDVPAAAYGEGVTILPVPAGTAVRPGDAMPALDATGLAAYAASKRRAVIGGGCVVTVAGIDVPSWVDADSTGALTALVVAAQINPALTASWKGRDGLFYELNAADVAALATGAMTFVQGAFAVEAAMVAAIDAGTVTSIADIDAAAWPSND